MLFSRYIRRQRSAVRARRVRRSYLDSWRLERLEDRQLLAVDTIPYADMPYADTPYAAPLAQAAIYSTLAAEGESKILYPVTWTVVVDGTPFSAEGNPDATSNLREKLNGLYVSEDRWMSVVEAAFKTWDDVSAFGFTRNDTINPPPPPPTDHVPTHIRIAGAELDGIGGILAEAHSDDTIVIDTKFGDSGGFLRQLYVVLVHEIGHLLKLQHGYVKPLPDSTTTLDPNDPKFKQDVASIMQPEVDTQVITQEKGLTLHPHDVWQIQSKWGDSYEPNDISTDAVDLGPALEQTRIVRDLSIDSRDRIGGVDVDMFTTSMEPGKSLSVRVVPQGFTYLRGSDLNSLTTFDALRNKRLEVELKDAQGNVRFATATAAGQTIMVDNFTVTEKGKVTITVRGVEGALTQQYNLLLEVGNSPQSDPRQTEISTTALRAAVTAATDLVNNTEILLERGLYKLDTPLQINGNVTLIGKGSSETILDGQRLTQILAVSEGATLVLKNVTLTHGKVVGRFAAGGAIGSYRGNITLTDVHLIDNQASNRGAAVAVSEATLLMERVVALYNHAGDGSVAENGTVLGQGGVLSAGNSSVTIRNSRFDNNVADNSGGAIAADSSIDISESQFLNNRAASAGAIYIFNHRLDATTPAKCSIMPPDPLAPDAMCLSSVTNSWIMNNSAVYSAGLAVGSGHTKLDQLQIEGNVAEARGGGLSGGSGNFTLTNSYIAYNRALSGAGVSVASSNPNSGESVILNSWIRGNQAISTSAGISNWGILRVESSTISENEALQWFGGGVTSSEIGSRLLVINSTISLNKANNSGAGVVAFSNGTVNLVFTTVTANTLDSAAANQGAGIHAHPNTNISVTNSIVAQNVLKGFVTDIYGDIALTHSLIGVVDEQAFADHQDSGNILGTPTQAVDARLTALTDNAGRTPAHSLLDNSPAIGKALSLATVVTDQTYQTIPPIKRFDLGSMESNKNRPGEPILPIAGSISTPAPIDHTAPVQTAVLSGISVPGIATPKMTARVRSSNLAVIKQPTIDLSPTGIATISYEPVPNTKGTATITATILFAGVDGTFGSSDDTQIERSFTVTVQNTTVGVAPIIAMAPAYIFEPRRELDKTETRTEPMAFKLMLSAPSGQPVSVRFKTEDGTAKNGEDYTAVETIVTFEPGQTEKTVTVPVRSDDVFESTELLTVRLDQASGASLLSASVEGTIYDAPIVIGSPVLPIITQQPQTTPVIIIVVHTVGPTTPAPTTIINTKPGLVGRLLAASMKTTDVDRSGETVPSDLLKIISMLNIRSQGGMQSDKVDYNTDLLSYDVNRDAFITPMDALLIINELNSRAAGGSGEGEDKGIGEGESRYADESISQSQWSQAVDLAMLDELYPSTRGRSNNRATLM